jgi:hypothetical protein
MSATVMKYEVESPSDQRRRPSGLAGSARGTGVGVGIGVGGGSGVPSKARLATRTPVKTGWGAASLKLAAAT